MNLSSFFTYNPAGQIKQQVRSNDAYAWTQHYNVDRAYGVNGLNQIMTAGLTTLGYDARGNLTSSNGQAYGYNADNMMTSAPNGTTMAWDPLGRLAQTVGAGVATRFAYDGINLIAEYDASNTLLRRYVHGPGTDDPIVWYEGTGTTDRRFLLADERGSIVSVTNSAGATLAINTYDEYGIPAAANLGRFQYTGQTWLPEAGLYHYKARMYSPTLGRFMQTDPIGYADGMNWYAYVGGDPVNFRDPLGLRQVCGNIDNSYTTIENGVSTQVVASRRVCYDLPDFGPIDFDPHGGPGGGDPNDPCGGRVIVDPIPGNTNLNPGNRQTSEGRGAFGTPRSRGSHSGIDITAEEGTPVVAVGNGIVVAVNPNPSSTYGNQVAIDLGGGIVPTYQHLQGPGVHRLGESVTSGDVIGRVGRTGNTPTGARTHLHFEIRVGSALARSQGGRVIDPETCLPGVYQ